MVANYISNIDSPEESPGNQSPVVNVKKERGNPPSHGDITAVTEPQDAQEPEVLYHASSRLQYI